MTSQRVKEILNFCPATMGSGLHSSDADDRRRLRASAVAKLKALLEKIKANIKVFQPWHDVLKPYYVFLYTVT